MPLQRKKKNGKIKEKRKKSKKLHFFDSYMQTQKFMLTFAMSKQSTRIMKEEESYSL